VTSGASGYATGGLVGYNAGTIANTYAYQGSVAGGIAVGGMAGYNDGSVSTSWSSGAVSGGAYVGGSIGTEATGGALASLYWDSGTSGQTLGVGHGSGANVTGIGGTTGLSPYMQSTYGGFDFSIWTITAGPTRPYLKTVTPQTPPN
jgi:hypothetical protein